MIENVGQMKFSRVIFGIFLFIFRACTVEIRYVTYREALKKTAYRKMKAGTFYFYIEAKTRRMKITIACSTLQK